MFTFILCLCIFLFNVVHANAVTSIGDVSNADVVATNGNTHQLLSTRFSERQSIRDFGGPSGPACNGVTDDSAVLAEAATTLRGTGKAVYLPSDCPIRLGAAAQVWLKGVALVGDGVREYGTGPNQAIYGLQGSRIIIDSTLRGFTPFAVSDSWAIRGINFYWAGQTEAAAVANSGNPIAYKALIGQHSTDDITMWDITNCQIENAYDVIDFSAATNVGYFSFEKNLVYAMNTVFKFKSVNGEAYIERNGFSPRAYNFGVLGQSTTNLETYASLHEDIILLTGDGTISTTASLPAAGLRLTQNTVFQARRFIHSIGGLMRRATLIGNMIDTVGTTLELGTGGGVQSVNIEGGTWVNSTFNSPTTSSLSLWIGSGASPNNDISLNGVRILSVNGAAISVANTQTDATLSNTISITGGSIENVGNITGATNLSAIGYTATGGGTLSVNGVHMSTGNVTGTNAFGVTIAGAPTNVDISNNVISGFGNPVKTAQTTGNCLITGNISSGSLNTTGGIVGTGATFCTSGAINDWDNTAPSLNLFGIGDPTVATVNINSGTGVQMSGLYTITNPGSGCNVNDYVGGQGGNNQHPVLFQVDTLTAGAGSGIATMHMVYPGWYTTFPPDPVHVGSFGQQQNTCIGVLANLGHGPGSPVQSGFGIKITGDPGFSGDHIWINANGFATIACGSNDLNVPPATTCFFVNTARNSANALINYGSLDWVEFNTTAGNEAGRLQITERVAGADYQEAMIGRGFLLGAYNDIATNVDGPGHGKISAQGYYYGYPTPPGTGYVQLIDGSGNATFNSVASTTPMAKTSGGTGAATGLAAAKNLSTPYVLCLSNAATPSSPFTGATTETNIATCTIPANAIGLGQVEITTSWTFIGTAGTKTILARHSATSGDTSGAAYTGVAVIAANLNTECYANISNRTTSSQIGGRQGNQCGAGGGASSVPGGSINTANVSYINFNILLANAADQAQLQSYRVVLYPVAGN